MKKTMRIILPIVLAIAIVLCMAWYLLVYDREFTRDVLLTCARVSESQGNHGIATWFYNRAYSQAGNSDAVAVELAQQYAAAGNFTKAEFTLSNAISDGGGIDVYVALSSTYVQQDKLLDAVNMLNNVTNADIKTQLETMRPAAPSASPDPGFYSKYISVTLQSEGNTIYASTDGTYPSTGNPAYTDPLPLTDGENTIHCVAVSETGLVSPVSIFGFTVGGVIEKMEFADAAVEAQVRAQLNAAEGKELYTNDLWTITAFTMPTEAQSYADLKHMIFLETLTIDKGVSDQLPNLSSLANLKQLTITGTEVTQEHLKIIGALPLLKELTLSGAELSGIAPLSEAVGLTRLDVSENTIRSIDAIKNMTLLQELYLQHNALTEVSALAANTALTKLDISGNNITSLAPLSALSSLTWLDAGTNTLTDLGEIGKLTALTHLGLGGNKLTSISAISGCTAITELDVSSNTLTEISAVSSLTGLMHLNFSYNQVTELPEFSDECALVSINGSNNLLHSLKQLSGLQSLNTVNMDYNTEISSVEPLSNCPVLILVNVYATKVTEVTVLTDQSIEVNYNPVQN